MPGYDPEVSTTSPSGAYSRPGRILKHLLHDGVCQPEPGTVHESGLGIEAAEAPDPVLDEILQDFLPNNRDRE